MNILSEVIKDVKEVMYFHYKCDISFPRSCGSISTILTYVFQNTKLKNLYEISYKRGHFKNKLQEEDCFCDENMYNLSFDFQRGYDLADFSCINCGCNYMVEHSWIELKNLKDNKISILDFTSIQFEEECYNYFDEIQNTKFNEDSLYEYLKDRSCFIIEEDDERFYNYIVSKEGYSGEDLLKSVDNILKGKEDNQLTIVLKELNYIN